MYGSTGQTSAWRVEPFLLRARHPVPHRCHFFHVVNNFFVVVSVYLSCKRTAHATFKDAATFRRSADERPRPRTCHNDAVQTMLSCVLICQALLSCLLALAFRLDIFSVIKGIVGTYVDICKITSIVRCVHTLLSLFHSCEQGWDMFTDSMSQLLDSALACEIKSGSGMVCVSRLHAVISVCCLIPCISHTRTH